MSKVQFRGEINLPVSVKDMDEAVAWYRDVLGLSVVYTSPYWTTLATYVPDCTLGLYPGAGSAKGPALGVADVDEARRTLEGRGVMFTGPTENFPGMARMASFQDPSGNTLTIAQKF